MTKVRRERLWTSRVIQFRQSGQTLSTWCAENNVKVSTFSYWLKKDITMQHKNENITP